MTQAEIVRELRAIAGELKARPGDAQAMADFEALLRKCSGLQRANIHVTLATMLREAKGRQS